MAITYTGHALLTILKDLVGQVMTEAFEIIRPNIPFSFTQVNDPKNGKNGHKHKKWIKYRKKLKICKKK